MLIDIFITFKDREQLFDRSFTSFLENTPKHLYRLTVVCDDGYIPECIAGHSYVDHMLVHYENLGLGPSINQALAHINTLNQYYSDPKVGDPDKVSDFICYCQDDLIYTKDWLQTLTKFFLMYEKQKNLGFASGVECIEHELREEIGQFGEHRVITKDWIRAANMFARTDYWMSMHPIPMFDPETGRRRAKPNDGMGSGVDWHFVRNHENSVCRTGKTCLVIPGLLLHAGYTESTWLQNGREMPESDKDKEALR